MTTEQEGKERKQRVYKLMLLEPAITQSEIAERLNLKPRTVSRIINKIVKSNDYQLAMSIAGKFIQDFVNASDYWKIQITELEHLKEKLTDEDKELLVKIMKEQSELYGKILLLARQGELMAAIRKLNGATGRELNTTKERTGQVTIS